ncbi:hypothetical protein Neosp_014187 [[Neocosmospora] mangrovei]
MAQRAAISVVARATEEEKAIRIASADSAALPGQDWDIRESINAAVFCQGLGKVALSKQGGTGEEGAEDGPRTEE